MNMAQMDFNLPNVRVSLDRLIAMRRLTGVVRVDGIDVDEQGNFTTLRIYFDSDARMQGYIAAIQRMMSGR